MGPHGVEEIETVTTEYGEQLVFGWTVEGSQLSVRETFQYNHLTGALVSKMTFVTVDGVPLPIVERYAAVPDRPSGDRTDQHVCR